MVWRAQTQERGPPSALAEISKLHKKIFNFINIIETRSKYQYSTQPAACQMLMLETQLNMHNLFLDIPFL